VLYIGRIHAKKNLLALVAAWKLAARPDGARLVIGGWGDDADVAALKAAIGSDAQGISFLGPVYGETKAALLSEARFAVLPSLSEGLPMAILEGWAHGTPTMMTAQCNLDEGFAAGASIECGYDAATIAPVLTRALAMAESEWTDRSTAARALAAGPFSTDSVAQAWGTAYEAAL